MAILVIEDSPTHNRELRWRLQAEKASEPWPFQERQFCHTLLKPLSQECTIPRHLCLRRKLEVAGLEAEVRCRFGCEAKEPDNSDGRCQRKEGRCLALAWRTQNNLTTPRLILLKSDIIDATSIPDVL
jgi:hypothetical protein